MTGKTFARVVLVGLMAATLVVAPMNQDAQAQSASGATAFSISFPNVVVLHYWSALDMTLSTAVLTNFLIGNTTGDDDRLGKTGVVITDTGTNFEAEAAITSSVTSPTAITLHIKNAWAVRAVGTTSGKNVTVSFSATDASLAGPTGNTIGATAYSVGLASATAPSAATVSFPSPGLVTPELGDVALDLDLTGAGEAGNYAGSWTLQATVT